MTHPILDHAHPVRYDTKRHLWYCPTCGYEYRDYVPPARYNLSDPGRHFLGGRASLEQGDEIDHARRDDG